MHPVQKSGLVDFIFPAVWGALSQKVWSLTLFHCNYNSYPHPLDCSYNIGLIFWNKSVGLSDSVNCVSITSVVLFSPGVPRLVYLVLVTIVFAIHTNDKTTFHLTTHFLDRIPSINRDASEYIHIESTLKVYNDHRCLRPAVAKQTIVNWHYVSK